MLFWNNEAKESGVLPNVHNWSIYYNDSLIYSTNPFIEDPAWDTPRWETHELILERGSWKDTDSIRINYSSDVIRDYAPILVIKDNQKNFLLEKKGQKLFYMEELAPFVSEHSSFSICYGQVPARKDETPDFSKTYINEYLKIIIE